GLACEDFALGRLDALRAEDRRIECLHPARADDDLDDIAMPTATGEDGGRAHRIVHAAVHRTFVNIVAVREAQDRCLDRNRRAVQVVALAAEFGLDLRTYTRFMGQRVNGRSADMADRRSLRAEIEQTPEDGRAVAG